MNRHTSFYITLSLAGIIFLGLLYIYSPRAINPYKISFLVIFVVICILGMLATIYPSQCLRFFKIDTVTVYECKNRMIKNEGHHPDCGEFEEHVFSFKNKKYCVGCTGLFTGAFLAILTCILYVFSGTDEFIFWMGMFIVLASLLQMIFSKLDNRLVKFFSNLGLVWGSSLILVGLLEYSSVSLSLYFLFLVIALIMTRSVVSGKNHDLICMYCTK